MTHIRVKGIHRVRKKLKTGTKEYHYAWRGGPRFWSSDSGIPKHGPHYWSAYKAATEAAHIDAGTFSEVIRRFLASKEFERRAPRTQRDYQTAIHRQPDGILARFGDAPVGAFNRPQIRRIVYEWRDSFASARVADHMKQALVSIVNWAVDHSYLSVNHLSGMTSLYKAERNDIIWLEHEIDLFLNGDPALRLPSAPDWLRRLFITALETGLRPGDLMRLARGHVQHTRSGRRILMRTQKRSSMVSIPVTPAMANVLDETPPGQMQILVGGNGMPFTAAESLGQAVSRRRDQCGIRKELRLYDARGTAATRLFEADASLREISAHMGWSIRHTAQMIETYVSLNPDASDSLLVKLSAAGSS